MKKLVISIAVVTLLVLSGCDKQDDNLLVSPEQESLGKVVQPNWIVLPTPSEPVLQKDFSVSKMIDGSVESSIEINTFYRGGFFGWVFISANATFQANSFVGKRYVTMSVADQFGTMDFSPSVTFLKPVIYNMTVIGLDLRSVNPNDVQFVYMAPNGNYYPVKCDDINVDKRFGKLQVVNAQLPHFSRYGWTN